MTQWNVVRRTLALHSEDSLVGVGPAEPTHLGCTCDRYGPDEINAGHEWWLDHVTNETLAALNPEPDVADEALGRADRIGSRGIDYSRLADYANDAVLVED